MLYKGSVCHIPTPFNFRIHWVTSTKFQGNKKVTEILNCYKVMEIANCIEESLLMLPLKGKQITLGCFELWYLASHLLPVSENAALISPSMVFLFHDGMSCGMWRDSVRSWGAKCTITEEQFVKIEDKFSHSQK